jgi:hypothetical protein
LTATAAHYGQVWTETVVAGWFETGRYGGTYRSVWVEHHLPDVCTAVRLDGSSTVSAVLLNCAWTWLDEQLLAWLPAADEERRRPHLERLGRPLARLIEAADALTVERFAERLREYPDTVLECVLPALHQARAQKVAGLERIVADCADRLAVILARPQRHGDDWSIAWSGCGCAICDRLGRFLAAPSERIHEWPLKADGRGHVHTKIDVAALPVRHLTRRQGRPYTLVLTKTDELFSREALARRRAETDLAWLRSEWFDPAAGTGRRGTRKTPS